MQSDTRASSRSSTQSSIPAFHIGKRSRSQPGAERERATRRNSHRAMEPSDVAERSTRASCRVSAVGRATAGASWCRAQRTFGVIGPGAQRRQMAKRETQPKALQPVRGAPSGMRDRQAAHRAAREERRKDSGGSGLSGGRAAGSGAADEGGEGGLGRGWPRVASSVRRAPSVQ